MTFLMFDYHGLPEGFEIILEKISKNEETQKLTHKEVRAYARCLLKLVPHIRGIKVEPEQEITALLATLSCPGLNHYDRSFLALNALKVLKAARLQWAEEEKNSSF